MNFTLNGSKPAPLPFQVMPELDLGLDEPTNDELPADYASARAGIPKELNDRLKAAARRQGKTALIYIGEVLMNCTAELDRIEAQEEAAKLKERFGANWIELLKQADASSPL